MKPSERIEELIDLALRKIGCSEEQIEKVRSSHTILTELYIEAILQYLDEEAEEKIKFVEPKTDDHAHVYNFHKNPDRQHGEYKVWHCKVSGCSAFGCVRCSG